MKPRLYADFQGAAGHPLNPELSVVRLTYMGTLMDLHQQQVSLSEGLSVRLYADSDEMHDLEADGRVAYLPVREGASEHQWVAVCDLDEIVDVPRPPAPATRFPCISCRADLADFVKREGLRDDTLCPSCETRIHLPLNAPPKSRS